MPKKHTSDTTYFTVLAKYLYVPLELSNDLAKRLRYEARPRGLCQQKACPSIFEPLSTVSTVTSAFQAFSFDSKQS